MPPETSLPLSSLAIAAATFDAKGCLLSCNAAFETMSGFAALEGLRPALLHVRQEEGGQIDLFDLACRLELPAQGTACLTRADGNRIDVVWTLGAWGEDRQMRYVLTLSNCPGEAEGIGGKGLTCTLKTSRDKYREAFDQQTELVCRFEPDTTILFVNDSYARAFGLSPREMIGTRLIDQMSPSDGERFLACLADFTPEDPLRDGEESFELAAGIRRHQWWRRRAIFDDQRQLIAFQSVGRDITDLKRRDAERVRLERIVIASPVIGVRLRYAPGWPVEYVSPNITRLTGWTAEDFLGGIEGPLGGPLGFIHADDRDTVQGKIRDHLRLPHSNGSLPPLRQVFRLRTANNHVRWGEATIQFEADDNGTITHLEAVINDVSAFVEAQQKIITSEHRLQDFAAAANDWFWETDADFRLTWVSSHAVETRLFNMSPYIGRVYFQLVDQSGFRQSETMAAQDEEAFRAHCDDLENRRPFRDYRVTLRLGDGLPPRRFSISGRPVFAGDGSFLGYRGTSTDISGEERTARALAESDSRYRTIFDSAQVALWEHDLNSLQQRLLALRSAGVVSLAQWLSEEPSRLTDLAALVTISDVNAAAVEMLGAHAKTELRGKTLADLAGSLPLFERMVLALWRGEDVVRVECPQRILSGRLRHVLYSLRVPQTSLEARHSVASLFDITDRVVAEEQLRDSEHRFRSVFDHAVPAMGLVGVDGRWMRVNQSMCTLLGQSERGLFGRSLWDQSYPEDVGADRDWMARVLSGEALSDTDAILSRERRFRRSDGKELWVYFTAVLLRDNGGQPLYFITQAVDITARIEAQHRAAQAESQMREAIAAMEDGFVLYDANDCLVAWNARFAEIYDRIAEQLTPGLHFDDVMRMCIDHQQFALASAFYPAWAADRQALECGSFGHIHEEMLHDGRWIQIKERRTPDGGTVGIRSDITSHKAREVVLRHAVEEARLADRAKSEFLANMSHELRTPLNAIIGFSEIIAQELFGPVNNQSYKEYAENIHESGRHLLQIISDILDLSKIEAGELRLETSDVVVPQVIQACRRMMSTRADARGVRLVSDIGADCPHLLVDELRLKQILLNILSNAVKFSDKGGDIRLFWSRSEADGLLLSVQDQGIGMDDQEIQVARSLFGQVASAFTRQIEGTGLGIPLCNKLMMAHGGSLLISSEKGVGTCVSLLFPPDRVLWPDVHSGEGI